MAGFEHGVGRRGLWGLPALAVTLGLSASAAHAGSPTLPGATAFGDAFSCFNAPCLTNQYDPQYAQAETSIYGVPLSTFGDAGSYALETVRAPGPVYTVTYPNTPGAVIADPPGSVGTGSVTVNRTHPAMVVDIDRDIPGGGAQGDTGQVNYWFEVVNSADPDTRSPVTLGVTAAGGFFGSTTADIVYPDYFGDNASAEASLLISPGPGTTTLSALEDMDFSYGYDSGISTDTRYSDTSANVSIDYGATSTFSGAFSLRDAPISIETNTPYQVVMYGTIDGEATMDASLFLDPQFTAPTGYDLYFSSGVENGGGVPEPSAWAMMILGMAGLGGVIRRRRVAPAHRSVA